MSHLSTLIKRVNRVARVNKDLPKKEQITCLFPKLYNLAEYMTYNDDYTKNEQREATRILGKFNMPCTVNETDYDYDSVYKKITGTKPDFNSRTCWKCGKALSNPKSIKRGMGPVCASRASMAVDCEFPTANELITSLDDFLGDLKTGG